MAKIVVEVYSEHPMTADAQKIIRAVLDEYPPNTFEFVDVTAKIAPQMITDGTGTLVFGTCPYRLPNAIRTISIPQIATKANAVSILKAALNQLYLPKKKHPTKPMPIWPWTSLDPNAPTAIDIETSGNLKTQTPEEVEIINIAFYQEGKWAYLNREEWASLNGEEWNDHVREAVEYFKSPIWHNGKFDIRVIEARTGFRPPMFFDTMLAHHVLNQAARDHKLKHLAQLYLGAPEWEMDLSKYTKGGAYYENIPTRILVEYNLWDVYWTYELWKFLQPQILADHHASTAFMLEMSASDFLLDVEQKGFKVDEAYLRSQAAIMQNDLSAMRQNLENKYSKYIPQRKGPRLYNPLSWVQTQEVLSGILGTAYKGSTDEDSLEALKQQDPRTATFIDELLEYRHTSKALSTYVVGALDRAKNGRVHTTFLIHGTTTGRLSSTGPNLQNIPRDKRFRNIYIG